MLELSAFGNISGFKVNLGKSQILNLTIPQDEVQDLQQDFPFQWATADITYLGITLAPTIARTLTLNLPNS